MNDLIYGKLKNNLKYTIYNKNCLNSVCILFLINSGSRNEHNNKSGIAHFIEHMLFKGTKKFPDYSILLKEIYSINAITNAFTSYEMTGYYFILPFGYLEEGLKLLSEFMFNSILNINDFYKEKLVVINENKKDRSNPFVFLEEKNLNSSLKNTNMKNGIGGLDYMIKNFNKNDVIQYLKNNYTSSNSIISISGNSGMSNKKLIILLNKYFNKNFNYGNNINIIPKQPKLYKNFSNNYFNNYINIYNKKLSQAFICLTFPINCYSSSIYYKTTILAEAIAGPMISILFTLLREKEGLVYNISYNYENFIDFGLLQFICSTDNSSKNIYKIIKIMSNLFNKLKYKLIPKNFLNTVIKYKLGEISKDFDNTYNIASYIAYDYIFNKKPIDLKSIQNNYLIINNVQIKELANELFLNNKYNLTIITNKIIHKNKLKEYLIKI